MALRRRPALIPYNGEPMHERAIEGIICILGRERVPAEDRCVNEGAEGCTRRAGANGWCPECWSTIEPA